VIFWKTNTYDITKYDVQCALSAHVYKPIQKQNATRTSTAGGSLSCLCEVGGLNFMRMS